MPYSYDFSRSVTNLDMRAEQSGIFTAGIARLELKEENLRRFNEALAHVNPALPAYSADQVAGAARRVLRAAAKRQETPFIRVRMRRAGEIHAAALDTHWQSGPTVVSIMDAIVAYMDDPEHALIARDTPVIGQLDIAILVDAAMDALRTELDDYADFCRFRRTEAERLGVAASALQVTREHWQREREQEALLDQHLRRVRGSRYGTQETESGAFRVR
ncbi:MAG: hypothetical protein JSS28_04080 [Proteobacteria bacterium]|nr:hypothetical protein [Pseudomonadota bacterium]